MSTRVDRAQQRAAGAAAQDRDLRRGCSYPRTVDHARLPEPTVIVHGLDRGERTATIPRECELGHAPGRANGPDDPGRGRDERSAQLGKAWAFPRRERAAMIGGQRNRVEVRTMTRRPEGPDVRPASGQRERWVRYGERQSLPGVSVDLRPLEPLVPGQEVGVAAGRGEGGDVSSRPCALPALSAVA